jgi:hypothetical protein
MGKIRDRMQQDLQLAGYVPNTRAHYVGAVARFVRRFMRSPEQMGHRRRASGPLDLFAMLLPRRSGTRLHSAGRGGTRRHGDVPPLVEI